tara:strand:- start:379 stop:666 length:288 start_codon:yes stop_codon:yes gene_type:complete
MKTKLIKLEQWFNSHFAWFLTNGNKVKTKLTNEVQDANDLYSYVFWYNVYKSTWYAIPRNVYAEFFAGNYNANGVLKSNKIDTLLIIIQKNIVVN